MRHLVPLLAALTLLAAMPAATLAAEARCLIDVAPSSGGPTDVYRLTASNFPVDPAGGSIEVRIDLHRLGTREGSIYFLFLIPGTTEFYLDLNQLSPEERVEPMVEGRYLVLAETPHMSGGCHAVDRFVVG
jgi:hypothetical protein